MAIRNDYSPEAPSTVENSCETLWDRVLRMCDNWFPREPEVRDARPRTLNQSLTMP
jgi:hypothetical protein